MHELLDAISMLGTPPFHRRILKTQRSLNIRESQGYRPSNCQILGDYGALYIMTEGQEVVGSKRAYMVTFYGS